MPHRLATPCQEKQEADEGGSGDDDEHGECDVMELEYMCSNLLVMT